MARPSGQLRLGGQFQVNLDGRTASVRKATVEGQGATRPAPLPADV
jgi:hypothetical protein